MPQHRTGHEPATKFLDGQLELDEAGYIITAPDGTATSIEGVFAAGDVQVSGCVQCGLRTVCSSIITETWPRLITSYELAAPFKVQRSLGSFQGFPAMAPS